jgi:hypothetical protein
MKFSPRANDGILGAGAQGQGMNIRPMPGFRARIRSVAASQRLLAAAQFFGLFLVVFGARLWLIQHYGNALPFWDQWDGEGALVLKPWIEGNLSLGALFAPHNEHRIVLTRLLTLGLFNLNGQWDVLLEMAVNAALCGVIAVLMAAGILKVFPSWFRWPALVILATLFALPFAWENTLAGFQSQFYFLLLFSLLAIWGLGVHAWQSRAWWVGVIALLLACLSMATGFFAAIAVLALYALRWLKQRTRPSASDLVTALICLAAISVGWITKTNVPGHEVLKAASFLGWLLALFRCLAWPWYTMRPLAPVMHLPIAFLLIAYLVRSRARWEERTRTRIDLLLAMAFWFLGQTAAIAYARGAPSEPLSSRYMDILAIGAAVNVLAAFLLTAEARSLGWKKCSVFLLVGWVTILVWGFVPLTRNNFRHDLPGRRAMLRVEENNVKGYVRSGNARRYLENKPQMELPYPIKARLQGFLDDPVIRGILPANVRPHIHFDTLNSNQASEAFVKSGYDPKVIVPPYEAVWGSFTASKGNAAQGSWQGRLESAPRLPYLRVDVSGYLGETNLNLELRNEDSDHRVVIHPGQPAGERWQANFIETPGKKIRGLSIVASDQSPTRWFAFAEPVEVGRLSYWTIFLLGWSRVLFLAGLVLVLVTILQEFAAFGAKFKRSRSQGSTTG